MNDTTLNIFGVTDIPVFSGNNLIATAAIENTPYPTGIGVSITTAGTVRDDYYANESSLSSVDELYRDLNSLIEKANRKNIVLSIEHVSTKPLAIGNTYMVGTARYKTTERP